MISASSQLKDVFYNNLSIKTDVGCTIEYNMNSLLDNLKVTYDSSLETYYPKIDGKINIYKKLFPVDSIIRPWRSLYGGNKYLIWTTGMTETVKDSFFSPRRISYPRTAADQNDGYESPKESIYPRLYYPGVNATYKYWVSPIGEDAKLTVTYSILTATVSEASSSGTLITYKTSQPHGFTSGQSVTITGLSTGTFNISGTINSIESSTSFTIQSSAVGAWATGQSGTATLSSATKPAVSNKIIARFEKTHALPSACSFTITYSDNTTVTVSGQTVPASGELVLHWNGTAWSQTAPALIQEPKLIKSIYLDATNPSSGKVVGVIEVSARWVKDISSDIVSFDIQKEASSSSEDLLPVGTITANNIEINLVKYDQSSLQYLNYNRLSTSWDTTKIYLVKNAELKPYIRVYHDNGALGTAPNKYDDVKQGTFYIDSFEMQEYGETAINALDSAKYLMETIAPYILCEGYPATGIIRYLLDSVGFTNYEIRVNIEDQSIPQINFWWTDGTKTVWECLQEICRDIQMNAFVDENNILQFYSRDYLYSQVNVAWEFYQSAEGSKLPNIMSFSKREIPGANYVKILWQSQLTSDYLGNSTDLWVDEVAYLSAGGLRKTIEANTSPENTELSIDIETLDKYSPSAVLYNYQGYVLIDSEIIEYDAIQYQYTPHDSNTAVPVWIESSSDVNKYQFLSKPGFADINRPNETAYFRPTGRYRVKTRGAFGTTPARHTASALESLSTWNQKEVFWQ
jgi:hypothetical protein